jgi:hypothetical protein
MPAPEKTPDIPDLGEFNRNPRVISLELGEKYADKHVAWDLKGEQILASADTMEEVEQKLIEMGIDPSRVVFDYIDPPGTAWLG